VTKISGTTGYQLLSMNEATTKSDFNLSDTIDMSDVAGIWNFQPDTIIRSNEFSPYKLFKRTGESENMVINLPERIAFHPKHLHFYEPLDTVYPNNFTIIATDYHIYLNWFHSYEYKLTAGLTLNDENAGSIDVSTTAKSDRCLSNTSKYNFTGGYSAAAMWQYGDTTTSSFFLTKDNDTLFKESNIFIRQEDNHMNMDNHKRMEKQYDLTIGAVELKKSSGIDSIQVFVGGVLQQNAAKIISNDSDTTGSICQKRDILLTFDDGTTAKLSDLIDPVREQLKTLRESLQNMYFAKHIVDYIALNIYFDEHGFHN
jgi:galactitol-specific phosphotransferase system IIB component